MLRVTFVSTEQTAIDDKGAVAPNRTATVECNVVFTVLTGIVLIERSTVDGYASGRTHNRTARPSDTDGRAA